MLGYVKCDPSEMLGKHHALYRAAYCGLCRVIELNVSRRLTLFYSYDFTFLALFRMALTGEKPRVEKRRCLRHPFRKRPVLADNKALSFAAFAHLVLAAEKMSDELEDGDTSFFRRLIARRYRRVFQKRVAVLSARDPARKELAETLSRLLSEERTAERSDPGLDDAASAFARVLAYLFSFGLSGEIKRIADTVGDRLGRYLYTLDALDDYPKDLNHGAFNPLRREFSGEVTEEKLAALDRVMAYYLSEMHLALALVTGDTDLIAVCENVVSYGLPGEEKRILNNYKRKEPHAKSV